MSSGIFIGMSANDKVVREIVKLLKEEFKPSRVYFYGSRVVEKSRPDSDYDFVMVIPKFSGDRMLMWEKCNELIRKKCGVLADVFTYSEVEFKKMQTEFSSIPETAVNTGREIDLGSI